MVRGGVTWTRIPLQCVTVTRPTSNGFNLDEYSSSQHSECGEKVNCLAQGNRHIFIILCRTFRENSESNKLQQTHNTTASSLMSAPRCSRCRYMFNHLSSCLDSNEMQTLITRTGATRGVNGSMLSVINLYLDTTRYVYFLCSTVDIYKNVFPSSVLCVVSTVRPHTGL